MGKSIVALDIDDVLFPFVSETVLLYNSLKHTKFTTSDFHTHQLAKVWGETEDETTRIVNEFLGRDLLHIVPLAGSQDALRRLASRYELHVVTSRPKLFEHNTKNWLDSHFPGLFTRLDMVGNDYDGSQTHIKAEVCQGLGSQYLIDDQLKYVNECADGGVLCVLFGNYAWNSDFHVLQSMVCCKEGVGNGVF